MSLSTASRVADLISVSVYPMSKKMTRNKKLLLQCFLQRLSDSEKAGFAYDLMPSVTNRMFRGHKMHLSVWYFNSRYFLAVGIETFNWNQEGLHGLGAHCLTFNGSTSCPTIFPAPPTLGATFNRTLLHLAGDVISTEARVYNNYNGTRSYQNRNVDLNVWL